MAIDANLDANSRQRRRDNLLRLLRPRHIAFVGGGQVSGAINASKRAGFEGALWAVNPVRDAIAGLECYPGIEALPEAPDAALIALSAQASIDAVAKLAAQGAGGAVCMADGFAELGAAGADLQQQLRQAAGDLAVIGPNCMGVLNLFDGAAVWGSGGHVEHPGARGAAIVSQSGAFLYGITNVEQGFPLGYAISTGNQAVIDVSDCIDALLTDERVGAIGIYLEGLDDGQALGRACWKAFARGIPIVALKGGDGAAAQTVALSHTSAMVVERDLWDAFSTRHHIVEVSSPKAMVETLKLLTVGGIPRGNRVGAITFSGGLNSLIAAQMPDLGLELPAPGVDNHDWLRARLPANVPIANPLDLNLPWASKTGMSLQDGDAIADCLCRFAGDVADTALLFVDVPRADEQGSDRDWYPSMEAMARVRTELGIPCAVAGILPEGLVPELRKHLLGLGIAPLLGFRDTLEALALAARVGAAQRGHCADPPPADLLTHHLARGDGRTVMLDEAESRRRLAAHGLEMPEFAVVGAAEARVTARNIGFPVALKLLSNEVAHKARIGGVKLDLADEAAVDRALCDIVESARKAIGIDIDRFLVERMVAEARAEYIIGVKRQAALGLALMIGRGGTAVESMQRYATVLLPLVETDLLAAMASVGLEAARPEHAAMLGAIRAVAAYAVAHAKNLQSLDVNPVIVTAAGDAIATDAFIVLNQED